MVLIWRADTTPGMWTEAELTNYLDLCERGLKVNLCVPAPHPFPDSTVEIETGDEPADFFFAGPVFVVSAELKAILEAFKVKAEFYELNVLHKGVSYKARRFYLCNILDAVACFDYARSKYKATPEGVKTIAKLVLDGSKAAGHHLFMVGPIAWGGESNPRAINDIIPCASEELATRILEAGLTGVVFTKPQHRRDYPAPAWRPH